MRSYGQETIGTTQAMTITWNITAVSDTRLGGLGFSLPADENTNNLQVILYPRLRRNLHE